LKAWLRRLALAAVVLAGIVSLLATSPPPPPWIQLDAEPTMVCAGDPVTLSWRVLDGSDTPAPDDVRIVTAPLDAFDPPVDGLQVSGDGSMEIEPLRPVRITVITSAYADVFAPVALAVFPCDLTRSQRSDAVGTLALAGDDGNGSLLAALDQGVDQTLLLRLDDALESGWETVVAGRVEALVPVPSGGFVAVGSSAAALGGEAPPVRQAFVQRYDAAGDLVWTEHFGADESDGPATRAYAAALVGDDVVVVGGTSGGGVPGEGFIRRLDVDGGLVWEERFAAAGADGGWAVGRGVVVATDGHLYVGGTTSGDVGGASLEPIDAFVIAFDTAGTRQSWSQQVAGHAGAGALALGFADTIALVGQSLVAWRLGEQAPAWTAEPPDGARWTRVVAGTDGTLVVAGEEAIEVDIPLRWPADRTDVVLHRLDHDGVMLSQTRLGSLWNESLTSLASWPIARPGTAVMGGSTGGSFLAPNASNGLEAYLVEVALE